MVLEEVNQQELGVGKFVSGSQIAEWIGGKSPPRLVVLMMCFSETIAEAFGLYVYSAAGDVRSFNGGQLSCLPRQLRAMLRAVR